MEVLRLKGFQDLAKRMHNDAKHGKVVYSVLFFANAVELIKLLLKYDDVNISTVDISEYKFEAYAKEYYIVLDDEMNLYVEKAFVLAEKYMKEKYLNFTANVLYIDGHASSTIYTDNLIDKSYELDFTDDEVLEFIDRRFPGDCSWLNGNCYYFALILKDRFPQGEILYDVIDGHFVFKYNDNYYDYKGITYQDDGYLVPWESFDEYDCIQKTRIIRDCIM